jgi:hypothetical protein
MADMDEAHSRKTETLEMSGPEPEATIPKIEPEFTPVTFPEGGFHSVSAPEIKRKDSVLFSDFYTRDYLTQSSASAIS